MEYYSHTIKITNFNYIDIYHLEYILESGCLLSRRGINSFINRKKELNLSDEASLYNGLDYISLCDLSKIHDEYSAYNMYVKQGLSLIFDKSIAVLKPTLIKTEYLSHAHQLGLHNERYSDLMDEVQVKNALSLEYFKGLLIPISCFYKYHNEKYLVEYLNSLKVLLDKYQYEVPIINLDNEKEIEISKEMVKIR